MANPHGPALLPYWSRPQRIDAALSSVQERTRHTIAAAQLLGDAVQGVPLADAPEIDLQAGPQIANRVGLGVENHMLHADAVPCRQAFRDRKSTRLNSSHRCISYAVFCLK